MALFVLSDTHLSLSNDKPMDIFGSRWSNHAQRIEKNWRNIVSEKDTVVIAGDISWAINLEEAKEDLRFLSSLPGKKIISRGNHDYWWSTASKMRKFFNENGIENIEFLHNNSHLEQGYVICGSRGWFIDENGAPKDNDYSKIVNRECIRLEISIDEGRKLNNSAEILVFLHFPPIFRGFVCKEILETLKRNNIKRCFFGHIHGVYDIPQTFFHEGIEFCLTSADFLNFTPYLIR